MWGNVRIHLPLGPNENFIFAFSRKYENFRENAKISRKFLYENWKFPLFSSILLMKTKINFHENFCENAKTKIFVSTLAKTVKWGEGGATRSMIS
jgi:hypothetical protein